MRRLSDITQVILTIVGLCLIGPFYALWIMGGMIADAIERRRYLRAIREDRPC